MRKTQNKEERKAKARIFSSGAAGCGGSAQKIDKRDIEFPCPHCDRVFKQVQSSFSVNRVQEICADRVVEGRSISRSITAMRRLHSISPL